MSDLRSTMRDISHAETTALRDTVKILIPLDMEQRRWVVNEVIFQIVSDRQLTIDNKYKRKFRTCSCCGKKTDILVHAFCSGKCEKQYYELEKS